MGSLTYDRRTVERTLPAVWDDAYLTQGFRDDTAPDPDMPKGSVDHSKGGGTVVAIADVRRAYRQAGLTVKQRQALLLRYGMDEPAEEAGVLLGIHKRKVNERCERGVGVLVAWLNGGEVEDEGEAA